MMKQTKWLVSLSACLVLMAVSAAGAKGRLAVPRGAQESGNFDTIPLPARTYSIGNEVDSILSPLSLQPFFAGLDSLRAGKDTVLTIVHLGDSHIQAGYYSGRMMRLLQEQFGNAGRGWIAPFKLSKTNEPDDYFISSSVREWVTGRCIQANKKCPVGIGGIGIQSVSPSINLDVRIAPNNGAGYSFNQAILYRGEKSMPMLPAGPNKDVQTFWDARCRDARPCVSTDVCGILADTFRILYPVDTLQLHSTRRKQGTDKLLPASTFKNVYYGFSLTNGNPGILYHSVGVNGAMYVNYTDEAYVRQLALLKPSLLIISLGTNETFGRRFRPEEFAGQVRAFVSLVKKQMPETAILLTTPPECYKRTYVNKKRTYVRNANTQLAAKAIVKAAHEEGVACWDLFATTGGKSSCIKWHKEKLMGRDRIHFTKEGYREQGTLLYRALMQSYNQMLKIRKDDE
ncbi:GDSL-type esterase/lipase family protein [uncultured Parabacteroides sp.]|uniref:GDSL-type esterase/lipase family protein n=1 Tax=uncultured Parabacteroides sp. TaxID=512312 RepID=UPI002625112C|nr:GDSL-type esterase/lipase family protein [uncultured Parabacteroides sp.]